MVKKFHPTSYNRSEIGSIEPNAQIYVQNVIFKFLHKQSFIVNNIDIIFMS